MQVLFLTAFSYAIFQVLVGFASRKLGELWLVLISSLAIVFFSAILVLFQRWQGSEMGAINPQGIVLIVLANLAIAVYTLLLARSFNTFNPSLVIPVVFGTAILLSTVMDYILSKRFPSVMEIIALLLVSGGLIIYGVFVK